MGLSEITSLTKSIDHPSLKLFKKEKYLGHGGFGNVWKVLLCKTDYYLAMKQLSKAEIFKKNFITNIFYEKDILNILYNVHIVNLYLTFQDDDYLYMIMDYLEGGDLRKHMKTKIFNIRQIKFVAACVIIGLEYIHRKGIIHRDIKPENLIFDDKGYLRISDFGIAIRNDLINKLEKNNDKSGTPGYMAPERIINNKNISYSYSSDFFSLGVILYELTMLKKPFRRNIDKIGKIHYNSYEEIISDLFNNEAVNITPALVKKNRNIENNNIKISENKKDINANNQSLLYLCDLINKLLIYEQKNRLGYDNIEDIKTHPFFGENFEWKKIFHRSYNSPFIVYESKKKKMIENEDEDFNDIFKNDIINFGSEEVKENFQKKFENFTSIHKITKEDLNRFYQNGNNSGNISKFRNDLYNTSKKYGDNNKRNIRKNLITNFKNNKQFFSQEKNIKRDNNNNITNLKYKIIPNKLFKENNNKLIINKNNNLNLIKKINTPKNNKILMEVIEENFMNNFFLKTNIKFSKILSLKNNISNLSKYNQNYYPVINSSREHRNIVKKPTTANLYKRRNNSIDDNKKNSRIFLAKNSFGENYFKLLINAKKNKKMKNDINLTDFNNNLHNNTFKTNRDLTKKNIYLKNCGENIINEKAYRDKIIELNNHNIDKAIKEIFMH